MAIGVETDQDNVDAARRFLHGSPRPTARVSIPVLGELVLTLTRDVDDPVFDSALRVLYEAVGDGQLECYGMGRASDPVFQTAAALRGIDERLETTDAMILACLIHDPVATALVTTDSVLRKSQKIQDYLRERNRKVVAFTI